MNIIRDRSYLSKVKIQYQKLLKQLQNKVANQFGFDSCTYYILCSIGRGEDISRVSILYTYHLKQLALLLLLVLKQLRFDLQAK
jgi:hypothetical protein